MKKSKVVLSAILAAAVVMSVAPLAHAEEVVPAGDYKIGFSQATMASPFYVTMVDAFENYCEEKGVEPMAISADEDVQKQNQDIMDMIAAGIDALILNPINLESVQTGIDACVEAGIPVITVDRMASSGGTAVVKRDNKEMGRLTGEALLKALDASKDAQQFKDLATILANRAVDVRPRIFSKTMATDCPDRLSLLQKAREISTPEDAPSFVAYIVKMPRGKDRDAAENLLASLCNKDATPILAMVGQVPEAYNEVLYTLAARTGGDAAKAAVEKLLASSNNAEKALGLRVLNVWADGSFVAKMEELLDSGTLNDAQFTALLRSFIRTVSLPDDEIGIEISRDGKLEKLQKAYKMATRSDEKALVLSRLAANRTEKSFEFAIQCADEKDSKVAEAAHKAIADHVHDTILRKQFPELAAKGVEKVLSDSKDQALIDRVKVYKGRMEQ